MHLEQRLQIIQIIQTKFNHAELERAQRLAWFETKLTPEELGFLHREIAGLTGDHLAAFIDLIDSSIAAAAVAPGFRLGESLLGTPGHEFTEATPPPSAAVAVAAEPAALCCDHSTVGPDGNFPPHAE
jgi:hypothetical protein